MAMAIQSTQSRPGNFSRNRSLRQIASPVPASRGVPEELFAKPKRLPRIDLRPVMTIMVHRTRSMEQHLARIAKQFHKSERTFPRDQKFYITIVVDVDHQSKRFDFLNVFWFLQDVQSVLSHALTLRAFHAMQFYCHTNMALMAENISPALQRPELLVPI